MLQIKSDAEERSTCVDNSYADQGAVNLCGLMSMHIPKDVGMLLDEEKGEEDEEEEEEGRGREAVRKPEGEGWAHVSSV